MDTIKGWMECSWHVNCNMNIDPNVNNHEINVCVSNKRHVIIIIQESMIHSVVFFTTIVITLMVHIL